MFKWFADNAGVILPFAAGVVGGTFALWRWTIDQKWRRVQYAQKLIKQFLDNERVTEACQILDTVDETVTLKREDDPTKTCEIMITDDFLISALSTFCQKLENTSDEQHIRHIFDTFFDGLSNFQNHVETGLIKVRDVKPYLEYWFAEMSGNGKIHSISVAYQFRRYLGCFGYGPALKLARNIGYPIRQGPEPPVLPFPCYCKESRKKSTNDHSSPGIVQNGKGPPLAERP